VGIPPSNSLPAQLVGHFGLHENPFGVTPDPHFLFLSETHREALASLINGIGCEFGFQLLLAQPGMGKTTLLFNFLERFRTTAYTAFLFQPLFEPRELLQAVLSELGNGSEQTSMGKLSEHLNGLLGRAAQERKRVIVVVDEAQNLDFSLLEALRQLSNFETAQKKLVQIVLSGQPQLAKKLGAPEQEQLLQRISSIGRLSPLAMNETRAYIDHRLKTAGHRGGDLFTPGAVGNIWERSKGIPRNINTLCFNAMMVAFAGQTRLIDERILQEASRDLDLKSALADLYQMDAPAAASGGNGKGPVPQTQVAAPGTGGNRSLERPVEIAGAVGMEGSGTASHRRDEGTKETTESLPPALVEAIARITQSLEEQKIILLSKSTGPAATLTAAAVEVPPSSSQASLPPLSPSQPPAPVKSSNTAAGPGGSVSTLEKKSPSTPIKNKAPAPPARAPVTNLTARQPNPVPAERSSFAAAPVAARPSPAARKQPDRGGPWLKVLSFLAMSAVLALVLVERFPLRRAGEVEASESGISRLGQGESSALQPKDSSTTPVKSGVADARVPRNARASESDDVTVRKFSTNPEVAPVSGDAPKSPNTIFFDQDSSVIGWQYRAELQQIADTLAENPEMNVILEGHTDSTGEEAYNLDLSSRRAIAVRDALINGLHVSGARLSTIGAGSTAPVQPNSSADGRAYNRRVEIRFVPPSGT
jgi:type II secretory pathway predicted ATPase ExeA/outer membrane protein OmpA-like peptidoglycan-associated protein